MRSSITLLVSMTAAAFSIVDATGQDKRDTGLVQNVGSQAALAKSVVARDTPIDDFEEPQTLQVFENYVFNGCFADDISNRQLSGAHYYQRDMNINACLEFCGLREYKYAGIEFATECYCGDTLAAGSHQVNNTDCNKYCDGHPTYFCGGDLTISTYIFKEPVPSVKARDTTLSARTPHELLPSTSRPSILNDHGGYVYNGCFHEPMTGKRTLTKAHYFDLDLTVEKCIDHCSKNGYGLAGIEYGQECHCGAQFLNGGKRVDDEECNYACQGDIKQACGGSLRLTTYISG